MSSRRKGAKNERKTRKVYEQAGYDVYSPANTTYGDNDLWNLFDLACFKPPRLGSDLDPDSPHVVEERPHLCFVQVKSNRAQGINKDMREMYPYTLLRDTSVHYVVRHDREGYRLSEPTEDGYTWLYDGRSSDHCIGDGLTQYLRGEE